MSDNKNNRRSIYGRGYYIALILCAAAIGISGYLYYRNQDAGVEDSVPARLAAQEARARDVAVIATQPAKTPPTTTPTETTQAPTEPMKTGAPLEGSTLAEYSMDALCYNETTRDWRVHNGVDIGAETGTQVRAAAAGTVYTAYDDETMGTTVVIRHPGGYTTCYASLDPELLVAPGDKVELGQAIGCVGDTALMESALGTHLHFTVTCNDEPMEPDSFLKLG